MSGRSEARFPVADGRRLREEAVARRIERLFAVELVVAPPPAAGPRQEQAAGCWVTLRGSAGETERAKSYVLSLCAPAVVRECHTDRQSVEQLLSDSSKLRDYLEVQFSTSISPGRTPSCVSVQGTSDTAVLNTIQRIEATMAPPDYPQGQPSPLSHTHPRAAPPSTAGTFSPPGHTYTDDWEQRERVTPHQYPNIPTPTVAVAPVAPATEREKIIQRTAYEIEQKEGNVVSRGVDSSHREQTIHYFLSLNFPRERIEAVVDSMGAWADTDDILKRLNSLHISSPRPAATLSVSRDYTSDGEPMLSSSAVLRPVVIDGSNVAMRHGNGRVFSCRGIQIAVDWFCQRGHKEITVFVPQWRKESSRPEYPITDQEILNHLEREGTLKFTPSRRIGNKKIVCYDDRFIVKLASETNGVIVSNDNFRDMAEENEKWRKTIENRLVMFTFVNDIFMVPEDPMGKYGPRLSQVLQIEPTKLSLKGGAPRREQAGPAVCPYGERCTFGRRCRFAHPEREGRLDPALLTSRSPNTSPAPSSERRKGDSAEDLVQKDGAGGHSTERDSPSSSHSTSPQRPRTSPAHSEMGYPPQHPVPHGYSQPQIHPHTRPPPSNYSQPLSSEGHYQPLRDYGQPHSLGVPTGHGNSLSPPPPHSSCLHTSPLHSGHSSTTATPSNYISRAFPIAMGPRNVTDRIQNGPIVNGGDDFLPTAPNPGPVVPPHHLQHGMDPLPGLVPRGDYPPQVPPGQFQSHREMYNHWSTGTVGYHHHPGGPQPHATNGYHSGQHHYEQMQPHNHIHRSQHDYTPVAPHPRGHMQPQPTNAYQNLPSGPDNGPYYTIPHHLENEGHRPVSMYGDMGMRLHQDKLLQSERFQSSQSSPELYRENRSNQQQLQKPPAASGAPGAAGINWALFKQAQARLPDQEEQIMKTMLQHPQAALEQLVALIQRSW